MKHKTFLVLDGYCDLLENTVFSIGRVDLGNNFSIEHLFQNMTFDQVEYIYMGVLSLDLGGNARIKGAGNFGNISVDLVVYDLWDFIRSEYDNRLNDGSL